MSIKLANKKNNRQSTELLDIISPMAIEFKPREIIFGDQFQTTLLITNYPPSAGYAWLSRIATIPGVVMSAHSTPTDSYRLIKEINISLGELESRMINTNNLISKERASRQFEDAAALFKKIDQENMKVAFLTIILRITANDKDQLDSRRKRVETILAGGGMKGRIPMLRQEEALIANSPVALLDKAILDAGGRNMPIETIAAAYPFVYSGINDGQGTLLGKDKSGGIALIDFWKREGSRTNSNVTIMGKPGMGKSAAVKKLALHEYAMGTKIIILDPEGEYEELCKHPLIDGDWINCADGSERGRINPVQVRTVPIDDDKEENPLYPKETQNKGALAMHFQTLRMFLGLYLKGNTKVQESLLDIAFEQAYLAKGIHWDTDPNSIPNEEWPTIVDAYNFCKKMALDDEASSGSEIWGQKAYKEKWADLALVLRSAAEGPDQFLWGGPTTIKTTSDFIVLDIKALQEADESIKKAQYFNILSWCWNEVTKNRDEKVLLFVDEAYLLVDPDQLQPLQFLRNTSKRIRKYGGGLGVITHNMVDFMHPSVQRFGQALIDNPVYKIIMGQGDEDVAALTKLMSLSEKEVEAISSGKRGEALFVAGDTRINLQVEVSDFELELFGKGGGR